MRRFILLAGCVLLAILMLPLQAQAQFGGPGGVMNIVTMPLRGVLGGIGRIARPPRAHAPRRAIAKRPRPAAVATAPAAVAAGTTAAIAAKPDTANEQPAPAALATPSSEPEKVAPSNAEKIAPPAPEKTAAAPQAPAAFWPGAHEDLLGYVFAPAQYDDKMWAHGFGDIITVMFSAPGGERVRTAAVETTSAVPGNAAPAKLCGEDSGANQFGTMLRERLGGAQLTDAQSAALADLERAIGEAIKTVRAACADVANAEPAVRMRTLIDRLWAMRVAGYLVRDPLAKFYDTLPREQKAKFERAANAADTFGICSASSAARLPFPQIEKIIRPTNAQKQSFANLQRSVEQAGLSLRASCPGRPPATPIARLDAALDRVDAITYTAGTLGPVFGDFYASLSDEQRARLMNFGR